jgi:ubiquinone biosynthesis UbiH/UbiF/VisC/COQ6 family hydroxylase
MGHGEQVNSIASIDTDIIISGAGPAGLCLARALSGRGLRITVVEQLAEAELANPPFDGREIALTQLSARLMRDMGLWNRIDAHALSPLRDARVLNGPDPFAMTIGHELSQGSELGWLVSNHLIRKAAFEAVQDSIQNAQDITLLCGEKVSSVRTDAQAAHVTLASGRSLQSQLLVAADSRFSETRRAMGIGADMHDFGKTMLVCCMTHEQPHHHAAWEWFGYGQTLALLPMNPDPVTNEFRSSVVLTLPSTGISPLMTLPIDAFNLEIQNRFDQRLGRMTLVSTRHSYPLVGVYPHRFVAQRFAAVGDAAVGMHPVTAHGFNFGLRGVDTLARAIHAARAAGKDIASARLLESYERTHRWATRPLYLATQLVSTLYTNDSPPARLLREAALRVGDALLPFKRAIAATLSGNH